MGLSRARTAEEGDEVIQGRVCVKNLEYVTVKKEFGSCLAL